jgi:hypothetical protein
MADKVNDHANAQANKSGLDAHFTGNALVISTRVLPKSEVGDRGVIAVELRAPWRPELRLPWDWYGVELRYICHADLLSLENQDKRFGKFNKYTNIQIRHNVDRAEIEFRRAA